MIFEAFKHNRLEHSNEPAFLVSSGDRFLPVTWKQFTDDIAIVSWIIRQYLPGGTIAILSENSVEWMTLHAACILSNAVVVPIEVSLSGEEIAQRLKKVKASVLVHSSLYAEKAAEVSKLVPGLFVDGFGSRKSELFFFGAKKSMMASGDVIWSRDYSVDKKKTSVIMFTSGTTSFPRGVELSIENLETFLRSSSKVVSMAHGDRSLMMLPLCHIFGLATTYLMLSKGVEIGVCADFKRIFADFERFRTDYAFLVPALAEILAAKIAHKGKSAEDALGYPLKWIMTGGAPLSRRIYEKLVSLGINTVCAYGLTETTACYSMDFCERAPSACSAGIVSTLPEVETAVSSSGELLVRGPNVMKGYFNDPEATARVIDSDGWFHTGDIGQIDENGCVWITGRKSRTIVFSSGKKVSPEEMESRLMELPGVIEALVTGDAETRELNAEIFAAVPEETVWRFVHAMNASLPTYQRIKSINMRTTPFPRTPSGKIKLS
jgi:long-chain acyl-CoA synthetase